jgi:hypothetical protein
MPIVASEAFIPSALALRRTKRRAMCAASSREMTMTSFRIGEKNRTDIRLLQGE